MKIGMAMIKTDHMRDTRPGITHSEVQGAAKMNGHTVTAVIQAVIKAPRTGIDRPTHIPMAADTILAVDPMAADPEAVVAAAEEGRDWKIRNTTCPS